MSVKKDFHLFITIYILIHFTIAHPLDNGWHQCQNTKTKNEKCCILENKTVMAFDRDSHICCNGTIKRYEVGLECCHDLGTDTSIFFKTQFSKCSGGKLYDIGKVKDLEDCHGKFYDAKTQLCCPDTTELKISYIVFDIKDVGNLCPIIRSKTGRQECEHLKNSNHACCGDKLYNIETEICCNGHTDRKTPQRHQCCGTEYIRKDQECCGNKVLKEKELCCGEKPYNSSMSKCVDNYRIFPIGTHSCNYEAFDPENEVCCDTFKMKKQNKDDDECCKPRGNRHGVTINSKYQMCKHGRVHSIVKCTKKHTSDNFTCCNGFVYPQPAKNSICCNGRVEWIKRNSDQENCRPSLCNDSFYDDRDHDCCNNTLINKQKFKCINKKPYQYYERKERIYSNFRICGIYAITDRYNCCAETMPYKKNEYTCPLDDFGDKRPIKPRKYPFWQVNKCLSEKMTGKIVEFLEINGNGLSLVLKEKNSKKKFTIKVSDKQSNKIKRLKNKLVNVYFEELKQNIIFLGEYGAIEPIKRRSRKTNDPINCEKIKKYFHSSSS